MRSIAALLLLCSRLCALLAMVILLAWAVGFVLSDRFYWSQFLAYIPTGLHILCASAALAIAWALHVLRRRPARRRPHLLIAASLALAALTAYFALAECRVYRLVGRADLQSAAANPGGLRILYWNASSTTDADLRTTMSLVPSDLAITANPIGERSLSQMAQAYSAAWHLSTSQFAVLSRNPVLRWGSTALGLTGQQQVAVGPSEFEILPRGNLDTGHAMWLEIDTRQTLGRTTTVWILDLPSDERGGRWHNAALAASNMRAWQGPTFIAQGPGLPAATEPATGFPAPDLVLGDLNTPRGSASLSLLAPGLDDVYAQGGAGYAATFPRRHPVVHIDLMLAAPWLRGIDYRIIDPGRGYHRMQWARLAAH